jgi:hypothetical protein
MKTRIFSLFILVVGMVLMSNPLDAVAQGPVPKPDQQVEVWLGLAPAQQQTQNVKLVGQIGGLTRSVALQGNYAYIGIGPRLVILDVSNPTHPAVAGRTDVLPWIMRGLAVMGTYAYVAAAGSGLRIINITNPGAPSEVGFCDTPGNAFGVAVAGSYAYVADSEGGLVILDLLPHHVHLPLVLLDQP